MLLDSLPPELLAEFLHTKADTEAVSPEEEARAQISELGYDPNSFWEQKIVWGDHDAFQ